MTNEEIAARHFNKYGSIYFNCGNEDERDYLIDMLKDVFAEYSRQEVEQSIGYACRNLDHPSKTIEILKMATNNIGEV